MTTNALADLKLPTIITLFGRPGSGKSTALAYLIGYFKVSSRTEWSQHPIGQEHGKLATRSCYRLTTKARAS